MQGQAESASDDLPKLIAFYLPQFHPIPENDNWWGKGFTEWTNVVRAKPLFPGHYQPHLPTELGFYDLRVAEVREAQAELAREHGIYGFCYYHYWFHGRRLLERLFNEVLRSNKPDFPFCLCWANENWTRAWDGREADVLLKQTYSPEDDRQHIQWLLQAFADPRYIRINGKPLMLVYRASALPDPLATTNLWRTEAQRQGMELFLARVESNFEGERGDPRRLGFDAAVGFEPDALTLFQLRDTRQLVVNDRALLSDTNDPWFSYPAVVDALLGRPPVNYPRFAGVSPGWDNTPRRRDGAAGIKDSTPSEYQRWLEGSLADAMSKDISDPTGRFVFVNAWNEWAEGCHLEPCDKWGRGYLEATRSALEQAHTLSRTKR